MDEQKKCVMPDYEAEYRRLCEENLKMSMEIQGMKDYFANREMEHKQQAEIMNAKLEMVYLIFGGRNHG